MRARKFQTHPPLKRHGVANTGVQTRKNLHTNRLHSPLILR
jgi:hypothetical protein